MVCPSFNIPRIQIINGKLEGFLGTNGISVFLTK
jgi:hypothetical protein